MGTQASAKIKSEKLLNSLAHKLYTQDVFEDDFNAVFNQYLERRQVIQFHNDLIAQLTFKHELLNPKSHIEFKWTSSLYQLYSKTIISLAFTQKLYLWRIFLGCDEKLFQNHLFTEMFSVLLLHVNSAPQDVPSINLSEYETCSRDTIEMFASLELDCEASTAQLIQLLNLFHSWGQMMSIHHLYSDTLSVNMSQRLVTYDVKQVLDISPLHEYYDTDRWISFFSALETHITDQSNSANGPTEPAFQYCQLLIQNMIFLNGIASTHHIELSNLQEANGITLRKVLQLCEMRPKLLFKINFEQILCLFDYKCAIKLIDLANVRYLDTNDTRFARFLAQNFFKNSDLFATAMVQYTTRFMLRNLPKKCENALARQILTTIKANQAEWISYYKLKPDSQNVMWSTFEHLSKELIELKSEVEFNEPIMLKYLQLLLYTLPMNVLARGVQCQLFIQLCVFAFAHRFEHEQTKLTLIACILQVLKTVQTIWLFDYIDPYSFLKKLYMMLQDLAGHQHLVLALVRSFSVKAFLRKSIAHDVSNFLKFLNQLEKTDAESFFNFLLINRLQIVQQAHRHIILTRRMVKLVHHDPDFHRQIQATLHNLVAQAKKELQKKQVNFVYFAQIATLALQFRYEARSITFFDSKERLGSLFDAAFQMCTEQLEPSRRDRLSWYECDTYTRFVTTYMKLVLELKQGDDVNACLERVLHMLFTSQSSARLEMNGHANLGDSDSSHSSCKRKRMMADTKGQTLKVFAGPSAEYMFTELWIHLNYDLFVRMWQSCIRHLDTVSEKSESEVELDDLYNLRQSLIMLRCLYAAKDFWRKTNSEKHTLTMSLTSFSEKLIYTCQALCMIRHHLEQLGDQIEDELDEIEADRSIGTRNSNENHIDHFDALSFLRQHSNLPAEHESSAHFANPVELLDNCRNMYGQVVNVQSEILSIVASLFEPNEAIRSQRLPAQHAAYLLQSLVFSATGELISRTRYFVPLVDKCIAVLSVYFKFYRLETEATMNVFITLLQTLLEQLCRASYQGIYSLRSAELQKGLEFLSLGMQRLFGLISKYNRQMETQMPSLVATYISQMQIEPIHKNVRKHLLVGLYKLIAAVPKNKQHFDKLYAHMSQEWREMFKILYDNYEKFYKYRGYV